MDLKMVNLEDQLNNKLVVSELEKKFSTAMTDKWVDILIGDKRESYKDEPFTIMAQFLEAYKERI